MAYAIARIAKLKGGSVAASDRHVERQRDTPNADRDKSKDNVRLIGSDRALHEMVTEMINRHGGKPRCDSVECVELMLAASPEYFTEGRDEPGQQRVEERTREFAAKSVEFLRDRYGERVVKAVLHVDEKTPHVQAFMVPIDERGRLNCKGLFGGRARMRAFQSEFAEYMQPLGLERGIEGSRATHTDIKRFYGAINREVRLRVAPERIPDPPRVMVTEASRKEYKAQVIKAISLQLFEPIGDIYKQAQLTREEKRKREAAERRAEEAERRAEQKIAEAKRREDSWAEKYLAEQKENIAFHQLTREYAAALEKERTERSVSDKEVTRLSTKVKTLSERVRDIALVEVMRELGYRGERDSKSASTVYRDEQGRTVLSIADDRVTRGNEVVARNAVDLVIHIREAHERKPTTARDAIGWLAEKFGNERTVAATLVRAEQQTTIIVREHEHTREQERIHEREQTRSYYDGRMSR